MPAKDIERIQGEIKSIESRMDALLDKVGSLSKEGLNRKASQWRAEKLRLEGELADAKEQVPEGPSVEERTRMAMGLFENLKEALGTRDKLELQRLLRFFISDVRVNFEEREVIVEYSPGGLAGNETGAPSEEGPSFRTIGSGGGI